MIGIILAVVVALVLIAKIGANIGIILGILATLLLIIIVCAKNSDEECFMLKKHIYIDTYLSIVIGALILVLVGTIIINVLGLFIMSDASVDKAAEKYGEFTGYGVVISLAINTLYIALNSNNKSILRAMNPFLKLFLVIIIIATSVGTVLILKERISIKGIATCLIIPITLEILCMCKIMYKYFCFKYKNMKEKCPNGPRMNSAELELFKEDLNKEYEKVSQKVANECRNLFKDKYIASEQAINAITFSEWEKFIILNKKCEYKNFFNPIYEKVIREGIVEDAQKLGLFTLSEFILYYQEKYCEYLKTDIIDHKSVPVESYTDDDIPPDTKIRIKGTVYEKYSDLTKELYKSCPSYNNLMNGDILYCMGKSVMDERIYRILFNCCSEKIVRLKDIEEYEYFSKWEKLISVRTLEAVIKSYIIKDITNLGMFTLSEFILCCQERYSEYYGLSLINHKSEDVKEYSYLEIPDDFEINLSGKTYKKYKNIFLPVIEDYIDPNNVIVTDNGEKLYSTGSSGIMAEKPIVINM